MPVASGVQCTLFPLLVMLLRESPPHPGQRQPQATNQRARNLQPCVLPGICRHQLAIGVMIEEDTQHTSPARTSPMWMLTHPAAPAAGKAGLLHHTLSLWPAKPASDCHKRYFNQRFTCMVFNNCCALSKGCMYSDQGLLIKQCCSDQDCCDQRMRSSTARAMDYTKPLLHMLPTAEMLQSPPLQCARQPHYQKTPAP